MLAGMKPSRAGRTILPASAREMDDRLEMEGLRKQIHQMQLLDVVATR